MEAAFAEESKKIQTLTQSYVEKLIVIWSNIFDTGACKENLVRLCNHAESFYKDLLDESKEKQTFIQDEIKKLQKEAQDLKRLLHVDIDVEPLAKKPLLVVQEDLDSRLVNLREQLRQRKETIYELLLEQESLCEELGESPRQLLADPLPTEQELQQFRKHLEALKKERVERQHKLNEYRREIKNCLRTLELEVRSETEDRLLNSRQIKLSKDTFNALKHIHDFYTMQVRDLKDKIDDMRKELGMLWNCLDTSPRTRSKFMKYTEYTKSSYDAFLQEYKRCNDLRLENMKLFVNKVREEIQQWWDKTMKSERERSRFVHFKSNNYTEDLLELHERELVDLKSHYERNQEIFELYADRQLLWERMNALEAKSHEPGRYNNRGGQLLKEEKERKMIANKLPKIEARITELVKKYEERERDHFYVYGENILDLVQRQWEQKREEKEKHSSARKQAGITPLSKSNYLSAGRTPISLRNQSGATMSLRKAPSTNNLLSVAANAPTAASTTKKRRLLTSEKLAPVAKRTLFNAVNSPNIFLKPANSAVKTPRKSPLKKSSILRVVANPLQRRSSGRIKKRLSINKRNAATAMRLINNGATSTENEDTTNLSLRPDDTYGSFEKCIEPASRSSVAPGAPTTANTSSSTRSRAAKRLRADKACPRTFEQHMLAKKPATSRPLSPVAPDLVNRKLATKNLPIII